MFFNSSLLYIVHLLFHFSFFILHTYLFQFPFLPIIPNVLILSSCFEFIVQFSLFHFYISRAPSDYFCLLFLDRFLAAFLTVFDISFPLLFYSFVMYLFVPEAVSDISFVSECQVCFLRAIYIICTLYVSVLDDTFFLTDSLLLMFKNRHFDAFY